MRYIYLIALAIVMAMPTVSTLADEPTADQRLRAGPSPPQRGKKLCHRIRKSGVFSESGLVRFRLFSGRIEIDPSRYRKGSQQHDKDGFEETITVSASRGVPSIYYTFRDKHQQLQLVAEYGKSLRIESTLLATGEQAVLRQDDKGEIQWSTQRDPLKDSELDLKVTGPTLLHIVGQDEAGFSIHLESLLTRMLRGRSVIDLAHRTEQFLVRHASRMEIVTADRIDELIGKLRSPKNSQRRKAVCELASYGTSIIPQLKQAVQSHDLDVEQVARIQSIIARSARMDDDTVASLACLLSSDRDHWQIMAKKMDQAQWIAANDHVRRCGLDDLQR